jgi:hypothetical protein
MLGRALKLEQEGREGKKKERGKGKKRQKQNRSQDQRHRRHQADSKEPEGRRWLRENDRFVRIQHGFSSPG